MDAAAAGRLNARGLPRPHSHDPKTPACAHDATGLIQRSERIPFAEKHAAILQLLTVASCNILDIGAGRGADAAWLANLGHRVAVVEPEHALRLWHRHDHRSLQAPERVGERGGHAHRLRPAGI